MMNCPQSSSNSTEKLFERNMFEDVLGDDTCICFLIVSLFLNGQSLSQSFCRRHQQHLPQSIATNGSLKQLQELKARLLDSQCFSRAMVTTSAAKSLKPG